MKVLIPLMIVLLSGNLCEGLCTQGAFSTCDDLCSRFLRRAKEIDFIGDVAELDCLAALKHLKVKKNNCHFIPPKK
jgi:hypothetical protein